MENVIFVIESHEIVRLEHVTLQAEGSYQHSRAVWQIGAGRHLEPGTRPDEPASTSLATPSLNDSSRSIQSRYTCTVANSRGRDMLLEWTVMCACHESTFIAG